MDLLKTCPWPARSCEVIYSQLKKVALAVLAARSATMAILSRVPESGAY